MILLPQEIQNIKDEDKTKKQLLKELLEARKQIAQLKSSSTRRTRLEKELIKTKDYLDNIIETSSAPIIITNREGRITRGNKAFLEVIGQKREYIIGKNTKDLAPEEPGFYKSTTGEQVEITSDFFRSASEKFYSTLAKDGKISNFESYLIRKDKKVIPVEEDIVFLHNNEGNMIGAVGIIRDITERKKSEKELKKSEERYYNLIEFANVGIIVTDGGIITQLNKKAEEIYGYSKDELIGKPATILTLEKYRKKHRRLLREIIKSGKAMKTIFDETGVRKDGSWFPIEISFSHTQAGGKTIIAVMRDISERVKIERDVREARDYLENIFKTAVDGFLITDPEGFITMANEAAEKMLGYSRVKLIGKHATVLSPKSNKYKEESREMITKLLEEGVIIGFETSWARRNGSLVDIKLNSVLLKDTTGNITRSIGCVRDITKRKQMEQQLLQAEKLKSLGGLAGGVAHDFNNVLAAILGRVQLLKMSLDSPPKGQERRKISHTLKRSLDIIENASKDGAETVRRIQEFSRIRANNESYTQIDINKLLNQTLEFTQMRWKDEAESKGTKIRIRKELSPLPRTMGNASELREVFTNLINNAIDAMPQGGQITLKTSKEENNHISIKVKDTGVGIQKDIRDKIFDPFFTTKGVKFSGLGLSVSYGIINRHRGDIRVASLGKRGTIFILTLPISKKIIKKQKVKSVSAKKRQASILVIEDDKDVRQLLSDILISEGHEVRVASNGKKGLELFRSRKFDLVLTDLGMPEMSGWQVSKEIKKIDDKTPVALITGWVVDPKEPEMRESGVDFIINKPFQTDQLLRLVQDGIKIKDRSKNV